MDSAPTDGTPYLAECVISYRDRSMRSVQAVKIAHVWFCQNRVRNWMGNASFVDDRVLRPRRWMEIPS